MSLILVAVNLIGNMIPNPIIYKNIGMGFDRTMYTGRLSLGQPAMASFPCLLSFLYLWTKDRTKRESAFMYIFLAYIFLSTAMTAYVIVLIVILLKLFTSIHSVNGVKHSVVFCLIVGLSVTLCYASFVKFFTNSDFLNLNFLTGRFLNLFGIGDYRDYAMESRLLYKERILQFIKQHDLFFFGAGPDYFLYLGNVKKKFIPIENMYYDLFAKSGIIGLCVYIHFLLASYIYFVKNCFFDLKNIQFISITSLFIAIVLYGWTLPIFATYCACFGLALFFSYFYLNKEHLDVQASIYSR